MYKYLGYRKTQKEIDEFLNWSFSFPPSIIALDVETLSLKDKRVIGLAIAYNPREAVYYEIWDPNLPWHLVIEQQNKIKKVWHNATFDLSWEALGMFRPDIENHHDSMLVSRLHHHLPNSLENLSHFCDSPTKARNMGDVLKKNKVKTTLELDFEDLAIKGCEDTLVTYNIFEKYLPEVNQEAYEIERQYQILLINMSYRGIKLNQDKLQKIDSELEKEIKELDELSDIFGVNPNSPSQVLKKLNSLNIFVPPNYKGEVKVNEDSLSKLPNHVIVNHILKTRKYKKLHSTYIHKHLGKNRFTSHFRADAETGRTMSWEENAQNIPTGKRKTDVQLKSGKPREIFIPDGTETFPNLGTKWDLGQIELRALARLSGDPVLTKELETGDVHLTTQKLFGLSDNERTIAKIFNFSSLFGASEHEQAKNTLITDLTKIRKFNKQIRELYEVAWAWGGSMEDHAIKYGWVETLFGRRLTIPDYHFNQGEKHIKNIGRNWPVQGSAADIFKRIVIHMVQSKLIPADTFLNLIHDEGWNNGVWATWTEGEWKLAKELEHLFDFWTPIDANIVTNFGG